MKTTRTQIEALEKALLEAGRSAPAAAPGPAWQANLMRAVRTLGPVTHAEEEDNTVVWGLVWKVAVPAAACAAALFIMAAASGMTDNCLAQHAELDGSVEYILASTFDGAVR